MKFKAIFCLWCGLVLALLGCQPTPQEQVANTPTTLAVEPTAVVNTLESSPTTAILTPTVEIVAEVEVTPSPAALTFTVPPLPTLTPTVELTTTTAISEVVLTVTPTLTITITEPLTPTTVPTYTIVFFGRHCLYEDGYCNEQTSDVTTSGLYIMDNEGNNLQKLPLEGAHSTIFKMSQDGTQLIYTDGFKIHLLTLTGHYEFSDPTGDATDPAAERLKGVDFDVQNPACLYLFIQTVSGLELRHTCESDAQIELVDFIAWETLNINLKDYGIATVALSPDGINYVIQITAFDYVRLVIKQIGVPELKNIYEDSVNCDISPKNIRNLQNLQWGTENTIHFLGYAGCQETEVLLVSEDILTQEMTVNFSQNFSWVEYYNTTLNIYSGAWSPDYAEFVWSYKWQGGTINPSGIYKLNLATREITNLVSNFSPDFVVAGQIHPIILQKLLTLQSGNK